MPNKSKTSRSAKFADGHTEVTDGTVKFSLPSFTFSRTRSFFDIESRWYTTSNRGSLGYQSTQVTSSRKLQGKSVLSRSTKQACVIIPAGTQIVISSRSNLAASTPALFHTKRTASAGWSFSSSMSVIGGASAI